MGSPPKEFSVESEHDLWGKGAAGFDAGTLRECKVSRTLPCGDATQAIVYIPQVPAVQKHRKELLRGWFVLFLSGIARKLCHNIELRQTPTEDNRRANRTKPCDNTQTPERQDNKTAEYRPGYCKKRTEKRQYFIEKTAMFHMKR